MFACLMFVHQRRWTVKERGISKDWERNKKQIRRVRERDELDEIKRYDVRGCGETRRNGKKNYQEG